MKLMRLSKTIGGKQQNNTTYKVIIIEVKVGKKQILFNQKYCSNSETNKKNPKVCFFLVPHIGIPQAASLPATGGKMMNSAPCGPVNFSVLTV